MLRAIRTPIILLLFYIALCNISLAQKSKVIQIKSTEWFEVDPSIGQGAQRLIGNVVFEHEGILMYCDSAYRYSNNTLDAFSKIRIQQGDSLNLYGDLLKYDGNTKKAEIRKNVRLNDREMMLTTDYLNYDMNTSVATYVNGGTIISKENTLTSKVGYYNSRSKEFTFKKDVVLNNPKYVMNCDTLLYNTDSKTAYFLGPTTIKSSDNLIYCENGWYNTQSDISQFSRNAYLVTNKQKLKGDSIYYDRKRGIGKAFRNVSINDSAQNIFINGNNAQYNEFTGESVVTGNALLMQAYDKDTLYLHADLLKAQSVKENSQDTASYRMIFAYYKVKFFKSDLQGKCDSLVYSYKDSTMRLFNKPVLWSNENQLTAEHIKINISKGEINTLYMDENAFIISQAGTNQFNQIKGRNMKGIFKNNKLSKIHVEGNGETVYHAKEDSVTIGVNRTECSNITIYLNNNAVEKITFITQPEAILYPLGEISNKELELEGFIWNIDERPWRKEDIFIW